MKRILFVLGGALWFALVFLITFRMTFPSDAVAERVRYEVQERSGGALALELRDVSPWWVGASAEGIRLFQADPRQPDAEPTLAFAAESARARVGLGSLMRQAPRITGAVQIGSSEVDLVVGTRMNQKGTALTVGELALVADGFPLADLAMLAGASMEGSGTLDIDVQLDAPESMRTATGKASIRGNSLLISKLDLASMGVPDLGLEIPVEELDLTLDVVDGKATVSRGILRSELATVEITGDITLRDDLERSTVNLELAVGSLGQQLQPFKSFLGSEWADGKFHYRCSGTIQRNNCRAERERGGSGSRYSRSVPTSRPAPSTVPGSATRGGMDDEERQRRREELRERLRQRREEARGEAPPRGLRERVPDDEEYLEDDEEYLDEEEEFLEEGGYLEEELPPEEEYVEEEF